MLLWKCDLHACLITGKAKDTAKGAKDKGKGKGATKAGKPHIMEKGVLHVL